MNTIAVQPPSETSMTKWVMGFAVGAGSFGAVDGFLVGGVTGGVAGFLIGALIGAGIVFAAWRPRPQDAAAPDEDVHAHATNYMLIWGVLFALTVIEVGVAFLAFSKLVIILILVALALWKAALVALYYMHLKYEPGRLRVLALSPAPLAVILVVAVLMEGL
jgi:cytochrome c oxidase subunit IV